MKKFTGFLISLLLCFNVFAQNSFNSQSVISLRQAKVYFDINDYGKALKFAEDAIYFRKQEIETQIGILNKSFSSKTVKNAGDDIDDVIAVLEERGEIDPISIINSYVEKKGFVYFYNSISKLQEYINIQIEYPEAQKLIGDVYRLEGEYDFAEDYYKKALSNEAVLDVPDEKFEILYLLAEISRLKGDFDKMEVRLLNVIGTQQIDKNKLISRAIKNTIKTDKKENVNKMFQLYRTYDYYSLNAYGSLADYYFQIGENDKALNYSALAVINGFSKICNILEKRNLEYNFNDLTGFFDEVMNYPDILEWGKENNVWKNFNVFSDICAKNGYGNFAFELLNVLAFHSPEKYWQQDAVLKLDTIDGIKNPD